MPYMDTIACAILFEASISLAAPGVQMEKLDLDEELKNGVKAWSRESCLKCRHRLVAEWPRGDVDRE